MKFEVTYTGILTVVTDEGEECDPEAVIEGVFDDTMRELVALKVLDPSVTGSMASGVIEMSAVFDASSPKAATDQADATFRSALHAAGVFTDGWDEPGPIRVAWHRIEADDSGGDRVLA